MNEPAHQGTDPRSAPRSGPAPSTLPEVPPSAGPGTPEPWVGFGSGMPAPPSPRQARPWELRPEPRRRRPARVLVAAVAGLLLLIGGIGLVVLSRSANPSSTGAQVSSGIQTGGGGSVSLADVSKAVVNINTYTKSITSPTLGGGSSSLTPLGAGTGMILSSNGEILTNNHVIRGAFSIRVSIPGRSGTYTASVVGASPSADVALLQVQDVSGLPTVTFGGPSTVSVGDHITALGNALGRGGAPSVSTGSITGLDRSVTAHDPGATSAEHLTGLLQTDARIVPGDSGGPLVDGSGHVVGMITAGSSTNGGSTSVVGFAIPADTAVGVVNQIRAGQESSTILLGDRGYLGVAVQPLDPFTAAQLGLTDTSGALVRGVEPGTPAADAGMTAPAVIRSIDGRAISSAAALGTAIQSHKPGDKIQITWVDQTGTHTATTTLASGGPAV